MRKRVMPEKPDSEALRSGCTAAPIPAFGKRSDGQAYQPRPGAYAVLFDVERRIAVLQTERGYFLPGGGAEPGEAPEQTLAREAREECGFSLDIGRRLGEAVEYVYAAQEAACFAKQGVFFTAAVTEQSETVCEPGHTLRWLTPEQAIECLTHRSQAWAVRQALVSEEAG